MSEVPPSPTLPPWQQSTLERILGAAANGGLHHAMLLTGVQGAGKTLFADTVARGLLCLRSAPGSTVSAPCGTCRSCRLAQAGTHPDRVRLTPADGGSNTIGVDDVRELIERLRMSAQPEGTGRRVGLILPADAMTTSASNSLLKLLEEPPAGVFLILTSASPARLLATIRSRCLSTRLPAPTSGALDAFLAEHHPSATPSQRAEAITLAGGAPFRALEHLESGTFERAALLRRALEDLGSGRDPLEVARALTREGLEQPGAVIEGLLRVVAEHTRGLQAGGGAPDKGGALLSAEKGEASARALHEVYETLTDHRRALEQPLNAALSLEAVCVDLARRLRGSGSGQSAGTRASSATRSSASSI